MYFLADYTSTVLLLGPLPSLRSPGVTEKREKRSPGVTEKREKRSPGVTEKREKRSPGVTEVKKQLTAAYFVSFRSKQQ
jgi:hypothetical protein